MPYVPTNWTGLGGALQSLFREITCTDGGPLSMILREAVNPPAGVMRGNFYNYCTQSSPNATTIAASKFKDQIFIESCWDFADYQRSLCAGNGSTLAAEGFQVGSPWHGDVLKAPVLFLSINPAITHRCFFPRWHPAKNAFTLAGLDTNNSPNYSLTDINGNIIPNNITANSDTKIYNFLTNRFQDTAETNNGKPQAVIVDANTYICRSMIENIVQNGQNVQRAKVQSYWNGMALVMNSLLGFPKECETSGHTKKLMRSVLSAEVIFWGTKTQIGAGNNKKKLLDARLDYFWDNFAVPLLSQCGAKILFLVGADTTREVFNRHLCVEKRKLFKPYRNRFGEEFRIAAIDNLSQCHDYGDVVDALKEEAKKPGIVRDALSAAKQLYHA
ncbi:MAG: hypothetical protein IJG51_06125 [Synergistaceae bacterium]|nr:hypothetical protein [Synergistaceae bacterium]MBQ3346979.1 hypothetical protein [Synergistaceae bacterium]MBQ3398445.1 hypothetical protein [Synergistaceae bacterium]